MLRKPFSFLDTSMNSHIKLGDWIKPVTYRNEQLSRFILSFVPIFKWDFPSMTNIYASHHSSTEVVCDRLCSTVCRPGLCCFGVWLSVLDACALQEYQSTCFTAACTRVRRSGAALLESTAVNSRSDCRRHLCWNCTHGRLAGRSFKSWQVLQLSQNVLLWTAHPTPTARGFVLLGCRGNSGRSLGSLVWSYPSSGLTEGVESGREKASLSCPSAIFWHQL